MFYKLEFSDVIKFLPIIENGEMIPFIEEKIVYYKNRFLYDNDNLGKYYYKLKGEFLKNYVCRYIFNVLVNDQIETIRVGREIFNKYIKQAKLEGGDFISLDSKFRMVVMIKNVNIPYLKTYETSYFMEFNNPDKTTSEWINEIKKYQLDYSKLNKKDMLSDKEFIDNVLGIEVISEIRNEKLEKILN